MDEIKKMKNLSVKDVCSKGVRSVILTDTVQDAAIVMSKHEIGAILIVDKKNLPVGIITNDDIIHKVVQYDKIPSKIICKDIMSFPLITIDVDDTLIDAMRKMTNNDVKRLIVMDGDKLYGVLSATDVLKHSPDYIEILQEHIEIVEESIECAVETYTGYCQICGAWSDDLKMSDDGQFVCDDCQ
ncbi:MAG: CBS domain-containing protein [Candidatus Helarchaeota archaeon]